MKASKTGLGILLYFSMTLPVAAGILSEPVCMTAINPDLNNDGRVSYKDLWQIGRSFGLNKKDKRYIFGSDVNCDGQINNADWDYISDSYGQSFEKRPEVSGYLYFSPYNKQLYAGHEVSVRYSININAIKKHNKPFTAKLIQSIEPDKGLLIKNKANGQLFTAKKKHRSWFLINRKLTTTLIPQIPGTYIFKIAAIIPETGDVFERKIELEVLADKKMDVSLAVLLKKNHQYKHSLLAKIRVSGADINDITHMILIDKDTGEQHKILSRLWQKRIKLSKDFFRQKACKTYSVIAYTAYGSKQSKTTQYCAGIPKLKTGTEGERFINTVPSIRAAMEMNLELKSLICSGKYIQFNLQNASNPSKTLNQINQLGVEIIWHDNVGSQRNLSTGSYYAKFSNTASFDDQLLVIQKLNKLTEINQLVFSTNKQKNRHCEAVIPYKNITHGSRRSGGFGFSNHR